MKKKYEITIRYLLSFALAESSVILCFCLESHLGISFLAYFSATYLMYQLAFVTLLNIWELIKFFLFICSSQKLTSPKWNRFKGIKLRWKEKIRLNNVIWRCWHMQCKFNFLFSSHIPLCPSFDEGSIIWKYFAKNQAQLMSKTSVALFANVFLVTYFFLSQETHL